MHRLRWLPVLGPLLLCSGCFRAASVHANQVRQLRVDEGSATIVYKNGDSRRIAHFDSITVQTNAPPLAAKPADTVCSADQSEYEFEFDDTTRGALAAPLLSLEDQGGRRVFSMAQVQKITLESYSPGRPWLIAAAATVGAIAGGALGYAMGGPCHEEEEFGCVEKGLYGIAGVPIGLGIGLAVGFPLTRGLGDFYPAPSPSTAQDP